MHEQFAVHPVPAPGGGAIGIAPLPGRFGAAKADFARIAAWKPAFLVSLVQAHEWNPGALPALAAFLRASGMAHSSFPIADFSPPPDDADWPRFASRLHQALDLEQNVILHCLGGKGRSGMLAMRLLIERGLAPAEACASVRAARPGAIETEAQWLWAAAGQPKARA